MARDPERLTRELRLYLRGGEAITRVVPLSTGHSNETYLLEGLDRILRTEPSGEGLLPPYDMAFQHRVLSAVGAFAGGPPVPRVFELCTDPSVIGSPFFDSTNDAIFPFVSSAVLVDVGGGNFQPLVFDRACTDFTNPLCVVNNADGTVNDLARPHPL